jgi:hypothetical protein
MERRPPFEESRNMSGSRARAAACAATIGILAAPAAVLAYDTAPRSAGNPNFRSVIIAITPRTAGLRARILGHDNLLELVDRDPRPVVVQGYDGEPYARLLGDGAVQLNLRSPAFYLNEYRFGDQTVPAYADARATPEWRTMDHSGRLTWHDHRVHWKTGGRPSRVRDIHARTLLRTYRIPIEVGRRRGVLLGQLWWVGGHGQGAGVLFALPLAGLVVVVLAGRLVGRLRRGPR